MSLRRFQPLFLAALQVRIGWQRRCDRCTMGAIEAGGERRKLHLRIEIEQETDGRWIAEVAALPGVLAYGPTADTAMARAKALALRVLAERLEHGEAGPELRSVSFEAA